MNQSKQCIKLPPQDIDAEEQVIASCLLGNRETFTMVKSLVNTDDFWHESSRFCWEVMEALSDRGDKINQITVAQELMSKTKLNQIGGAAYLSHLVSICQTHLDAESYAYIVRRLSTSRQLVKAGESIMGLGNQGDPEVEKKIVEAEEILFKLHERRAKSRLLTPKDIAEIALQRYTGLNTDGDSTAIPYGFTDLDSETGGAHRGDFILVGGRPRIGKTSLLLSFARRMSLNHRILLVSAEMSVEQVLDREVSAATNLPVAIISHGHYKEPVFDKIIGFTGPLSESNIYVLPRSGSRTTSDITAEVRRLKHEVGLDVVMVDYIGILADEFGPNTNERVSYISRKLKGIAGEYDVAMIAASQLSRDVEKFRVNKRPMLTDLRDSGSLEQDADVVMLLYRDDVYYTAEQWVAQFDKHEALIPYPKGKAELILAKQRQRESNITVFLNWEGMTMQYLEYDGV